MQVSVSPQGFPSEKNLAAKHPQAFHTLFTGKVFFARKRLRSRDSRRLTENWPAAMPARAWRGVKRGGMVRAILFLAHDLIEKPVPTFSDHARPRICAFNPS
jgi:hypothetical protein